MDKSKYIRIIFVLLFILVASKAFAEDIFIPIGKTIPLPFRSNSMIHVSNGKLLKLRELNSKVLATGLKEGELTLTVSNKTHRAIVANEIDIESFIALSAEIAKMRGLSISLKDGRTTIRGELLRVDDWKKLYSLSQEKSLRWIMSAVMIEADQKILEEFINKEMAKSSVPIPSLTFQPKFQAIIPANLKQYADRYLNLLEPFGFQIVEDKDALLIEPMVDLKVQMVELKKSSFRKLGISLPDSYSAQVLPAENFKVLGNSFQVALNAMEQDGSAKVIAEPHLSCRSGKEAKFLAGGEFPIKIINFQTNDIQWKKHGIMLSFKPLADRSGKLSLSLSVEISLIDQAQSIDGIPGLLVNRVESHLNLVESQTIVLSGLIKEQTGKSTQGIAALKNIPVIGLLFSSEDFRNDRTELVVFVTPKVLL